GAAWTFVRSRVRHRLSSAHELGAGPPFLCRDPGATGVGIFLGRSVRHLSETLKEPFGVLQAALLGVVGLLLAFGLSLAVTRYEDRRTNIVTEANAIGTTYLRAQTLADPVRSRSLGLLTRYTR